MKIIVPVKRVPDTAGEKTFGADDTVDRDAGEAVLCPVNEFAIEEAVRLKEAGEDVHATALCLGPQNADATVRKALTYGLDDAVHIVDDGLAGSDAIGTARAIAGALKSMEWDLVIFGNQSTDARTSLVPAAVAEFLGVPSMTYARKLTVNGDEIEVHREHEEGWDVTTTKLPAIVSVVEAINDPRYPSFKGIMAAKSKPVDTKGLGDIDVAADTVGKGAATAVLLKHEPRPPKEAGTIVTDEGDGAAAKALADWLADKKFV